MALVRLPMPVPCQDFNPRPDLVFFLRHRFISEDQPVILALDGSCLVFAKQELYQKASWAVIASDMDTFKAKWKVHVKSNPGCRGARSPFGSC
jgi:hypothetical protein